MQTKAWRSHVPHVLAFTLSPILGIEMPDRGGATSPYITPDFNRGEITRTKAWQSHVPHVLAFTLSPILGI